MVLFDIRIAICNRGYNRDHLRQIPNRSNYNRIRYNDGTYRYRISSSLHLLRLVSFESFGCTWGKRVTLFSFLHNFIFIRSHFVRHRMKCIYTKNYTTGLLGKVSIHNHFQLFTKTGIIFVKLLKRWDPIVTL